MLISCQKETSSGANPEKINNCWKPQAGITFDWVLTPVTIADSFTAKVADVDAFETSEEVITLLHNQGRMIM